MENSFFGHSWHAASGKPYLTSLNRMAFTRKQNPFVFFVFFVYFAVKKQTDFRVFRGY